MIQEDLITYETAVLAKSKGFNIPCFEYYYGENPKLYYCNREEDEPHDNSILMVNGLDMYEYHYCAPTQSLLAKWLRVNHNIHINITKSYEIHKLPAKFDGWVIYIAGKDWETRYEINTVLYSKYYDTYEQALEAGLQHALTLI